MKASHKKLADTRLNQLECAVAKYRTTLKAHIANPQDGEALEKWDAATSRVMALINNDEVNIIAELLEQRDAERQERHESNSAEAEQSVSDNKQVDELVMWVKRLAYSLRNARPDSNNQREGRIAMTNKDGWSAAAVEQRKKLAKLAEMQLEVVEALLSEIISSYSDEKVSSAHPKSGVMQTMKRLQGIKKEVGQIK